MGIPTKEHDKSYIKWGAITERKEKKNFKCTQREREEREGGRERGCKLFLFLGRMCKNDTKLYPKLRF